MTTSIMNTAQSALQAAQAGLLVTSQNIAGASVDGFSRRNAISVVSSMAPNSSMLMGTGFSVEGSSRYFSGLLETQRRTQQGKTSYSNTLVQSTEMLDALMADQTNSLASAYSDFFNAAGTLVTDPANTAYRSNLTFKANVLVQRVVDTADNLRVIEQDSLIALKSTLQSVNDVSASLAQVNAKIQEGSAPGNFTPSADVLDERDRLLMQLQKMVGGQSVINSDGTASHYIQGTPLVERGLAAQFQASQISSASGSVTLRLATGSTTSLDLSTIDGGQAGAYVNLLNNFLPEMNRRLDAMAIATVTTVNSAGTDATGNDFNIFAFKTDAGSTVTRPSYNSGTPPVVTYLTNAIASDVAGLRAKLDPSSASYNKDLALGFADLKASNLISVAPSSPGDYDNGNGIDSTWATNIEGLRSVFVEPISDLVGTVGTQIASWVSEDKNNTSVMNVLNDRRESVSGVNLDEEAANMVKFQQFYAAASKMIQTGNQMFETLLAMMA